MRFIGNAPVDGEVRAIASGALANGDTVVVNSDGTVSAVAATSASTGSEAVYETAEVGFNTAVFDSSNNKVIIVYRTNTPLMKYVVGTVSGSSIAFGSAGTAMSSDNQQLASVFDSANNRIVVVFRNGNDSSHGYAIVGSLSGTTVSWGSATEFNNNTTAELAVAFDSTANKVVISYRDYGNSSYGTAVVGTISGTSISFGTPVVYYSNTARYQSSTFDTLNDKIVTAFRGNTSGYGEAVVGAVSGTGISFGSSVVFSTQTSGGTADIATAFDSSSNKVVIGWQDGTTSNRGAAVVGTVSGTSISFGSKVFFADSATASVKAVFDTSANKVVFSYKDNSNSFYGTVVSGSVSGTSISFGAETVFNTGTTDYIGMCFDSNANKSVMVYTDQGNTGDGTAITFAAPSTNLTSENFAGFANSGYASGQSAALNSTCSVDNKQSGLTAGQTYYVQTDGSLGTSPASPSVVAGTAISSNSIIVKG
jgi:hypothetical protein